MLKPVVEPPYNPLDKSQNVDQRIASVHSRKLPFSKETTITTDGMKLSSISWIFLLLVLLIKTLNV